VREGLVEPPSMEAKPLGLNSEFAHYAPNSSGGTDNLAFPLLPGRSILTRGRWETLPSVEKMYWSVRGTCSIRHQAGHAAAENTTLDEIAGYLSFRHKIGKAKDVSLTPTCCLSVGMDSVEGLFEGKVSTLPPFADSAYSGLQPCGEEAAE